MRLAAGSAVSSVTIVQRASAASVELVRVSLIAGVGSAKGAAAGIEEGGRRLGACDNLGSASE
jgi:hypothetical protein